MHVGLPSLILISRVNIACLKQWGIQHWSQGEISFASEYLVVRPHNFQNIQWRSDTLNRFQWTLFVPWSTLTLRTIFLQVNSLGLQFKDACSKVHCRGERPERHWLIQGERRFCISRMACLKENWNICFSFQVFLKDASGPISPFHDIPYKASDSTFHVVIEIPRCLVVNI